MKVLVTGACGYLASLLLEDLAARHEVVLVDVTDRRRDGAPVPGVQLANLADPDRSRYQALFEGVDRVVHLAYRRSSPGGIFVDDVPQIDRFAVENANVVMANNVYRAAWEAGVPRVVVASSNHATDWYEHALVHAGLRDVVGPRDYPAADNFYGWAKAASELAAWPYACGRFGRRMEFVHLRIGFPSPVDADAIMAAGNVPPAGSPLANLKRYLGAWLSPGDCRRLFARAMEAPDVSNGQGIPSLVVYGVSNNTRRFWSLDGAERLGYQPEDDSEEIYAAAIRKYL